MDRIYENSSHYLLRNEDENGLETGETFVNHSHSNKVGNVAKVVDDILAVQTRKGAQSKTIKCSVATRIL